MRFLNRKIQPLWIFSVGFAVIVATAPSQAVAQGTGTLFVESDKVGVGISTPAVPLHVQVDDAGFPDLFRVENVGNSFAGFRFSTTDGNIDFNNANGNRFRLNMDDGDPWELQLDGDGDLTIRGSIITAGSCSSGCDRVFSPDYELPSIEEHSAAMWSNSHLPMVGPTPEGQPFNLTDKTERMLNELEKAHIYIDQLNSSLKAKDGQIADLEARLSNVESALQTQN